MRTEAAALRPLGRTVRAPGRVEPDERRVFDDRAEVRGAIIEAARQPAATSFGRARATIVRRLQPEMVSAQREYAIARCQRRPGHAGASGGIVH